MAGCVATALLVVWIWGCGNPDAPPVSGSLEEANVKGTVRVRGKAVTNGTVSFRAANINRPTVPLRDFPIGKDGTYSGKALIGRNAVEVSCKELATPKNRDLIENERAVEVQSGDNTIDVDIPVKPSTAPPPTAPK
jgi:hypothetical protein